MLIYPKPKSGKLNNSQWSLCRITGTDQNPFFLPTVFELHKYLKFHTSVEYPHWFLISHPIQFVSVNHYVKPHERWTWNVARTLNRMCEELDSAPAKHSRGTPPPLPQGRTGKTRSSTAWLASSLNQFRLLWGTLLNQSNGSTQGRNPRGPQNTGCFVWSPTFKCRGGGWWEQVVSEDPPGNILTTPKWWEERR